MAQKPSGDERSSPEHLTIVESQSTEDDSPKTPVTIQVKALEEPYDTAIDEQGDSIDQDESE